MVEDPVRSGGAFHRRNAASRRYDGGRRQARGGGVTTSAAFRRSFDSIPEIFALTEETFAREGIDIRLLPIVDLALEELFTNMVQYSTTTTKPLQVEVVPITK